MRRLLTWDYHGPILILSVIIGLSPISPVFAWQASTVRPKVAGLQINSVQIGWPARRAGLENGDVITKVDGVGITSENQFLQSVRSAAAERRELTLTVIDIRTKSEAEIKVRPSARHGRLGIFYTFIQLPRPQPGGAGTTDEVVREIQELFEKKGFDIRNFPSGNLDPRREDPLVFDLLWSTVRGDLEKLLERRLALDAPVSLQPFCIEQTRLGTVTYRLVFPQQQEAVRRVLQRVLPLQDRSFVPLYEEHKAMYVKASQFLPRFRDGKDGVNLGEVEQALLALIQNDKGPLHDLGLAPVSPVARRPHGVRVVTGWAPARYRETRNGKYFWRLHVGVESHPTDQGVWNLIAKIDIGWRPFSEHDPAKTRWLGDTASHELSGELAIPITVKDASENGEKWASRSFRIKGTGQKTVTPGMAGSTLADAAKKALEQCQRKLCGKVIE